MMKRAVLLLSCAALVPAVALGADQRRGQQARTTGSQAMRSMIVQTTPGQLAETPELFVGERVSVIAEVEDMVGSQLLTLDEERWFEGPDILVVLPRAIDRIADGEKVRVVGTLRPLVVADLEEDYGWFNASLFNDLDIDLDEHNYAIVATAIVSADGRDVFEDAWVANEEYGGDDYGWEDDESWLAEGDEYGYGEDEGWMAEDDDYDY